MNAQTDQQLLRDYAESHSELAFAELARRHIDLVYSAARRMVGDSHLAEDMTQGVFVALAQNARQLTHHPVLSGWLHRTTQNLAANAVRTNVRRQKREQEAVVMNELLSAEPDTVWEHIAPHLDAALGELSEPDRDALLLRYFERKSAREMAQLLGISDDAAQKRVNRAVERLREFFAQRGVTVEAGGLLVVISANAVEAAPVGLAVTISTVAALAGTTPAAAATATAIKTLAMTTLQKTLVTVTFAALAGVGIYEARQAAQLRQQIQTLQQQQSQLQNEKDAALSAAAVRADELDRMKKDQGELLQLRSQVGALRKQFADLEKLRGENRRLQGALAAKEQSSSQANSDSDADPQRQMAIAKMDDAKLLVLGLLLYTADHPGNLPTGLDQLSNYWANSEMKYSGTNQFDLVAQDTPERIKNPSETVVFREKDAWWASGKWHKSYAYADGHAEIKTEPPEGFAVWEQQHIPAPKAANP